MITAYVHNNGYLMPVTVGENQPLPADAIWVDLLAPTRAEETSVEKALGINLPSREEMSEIEISSRLYQENGMLFMTATLMAHTETDIPVSEPVTFILTGKRLITIRFSGLTAFSSYTSYVQRQPESNYSSDALLVGLLDSIVDRIADILERVQREMSQVSSTVFAQEKADFEEALRAIGMSEALTTRARESLVSIGRLLTFLSRPNETKISRTMERSLKTLSRDVMSLSDHSTFLANNITFMLNTTLGMINIQQTDIIKIFSVMAVVFLPPTLIASIYGMNFHFMPEISWKYGYPVSLVLMLISAILPYLYFKWKRWL
ncbi:MAG: magnesium/cobalt transporter CorA [Alphaproteobacteria bacterium]